MLGYSVLALQYAEGNESVVEGRVDINGKSVIGLTDRDFICATLDWWPPEKCDYGTCSWDHASLLNLVCLLLISMFLDSGLTFKTNLGIGTVDIDNSFC